MSLDSEIKLAKENIKQTEIKFEQSSFEDRNMAITELLEAEEILHQLLAKKGEYRIENNKKK